MGNDDSLAEEIATVAEDLLSILPTDPADITDDVRKEMDGYADSLEELMERIEVGYDWAGVVALLILLLKEIRKSKQTHAGLRFIAQQIQELIKKLRRK